MTVDQLKALLTGLPGDMPVKISDWNGYVYDTRDLQLALPWGELAHPKLRSAQMMQEQDIIGWEDKTKYPDEDWFVLCADK